MVTFNDLPTIQIFILKIPFQKMENIQLKKTHKILINK